MPITIETSTHSAREYHGTQPAISSENLLKNSCRKEFDRCKQVIQSSFNDFPEDKPIYPSSNGFVRSAIAAYSYHHHLSIRPEDIWFSILCQLSFFVNKHSEELRSFFVTHEGQKELHTRGDGNPPTADFGAMAICMTDQIAKNIIDPELRTWVMPNFSTTTNTDKVVAAILMMGSLQKYFGYTMHTRCGIPSVTLLGVRADWENILNRLEMLPRLGPEPTQFAELLKPILKNFIASFDSPSDTKVLDFWSKIAHELRRSGSHTLSGWITAFCFWDEKGKLLRRGKYETTNPDIDISREFDASLYHRIEISDIPSGYASVPVTVDDNGEIHHTRMVAGSVGIGVTSSGHILDAGHRHMDRGFRYGPRGEHIPLEIEAQPENQPGLDSLQPVSGFWMYELFGDVTAVESKAQRHQEICMDEEYSMIRNMEFVGA